MKELKYTLDLQHFAEDPKPVDPEPAAPETPSFKDILSSNPDYQAAFDEELEAQKVQLEAINTQKTEEKLSAAEKLAQMSDEERRQVEMEARIAELEERERGVELAELKSEARKLVESEGLPSELAELVNYGSAEDVQTSVKNIKLAFDTAVSKQVKDIARGTSKPQGSRSPKPKLDDEDRKLEQIAKRLGLKQEE